MKFAKKLLGEKYVEAVLQRLDRLTPDEARTTAMQTLEVVYGLVQNMRVVMDGEHMQPPYRKLNADYPHVQMAGHLLTTSVIPSVSFACVGDNGPIVVSDGVLELLQQIASDLNRSKRQLFLRISTTDKEY